jgi:hypothetical protein
LEPIFVAGCERSGTTLLGSLLARGGEAVAPPEAQFLVEGLSRTGVGRGDLRALGESIGASWRFALWDLPAELPARLAARASGPAALMGGLAAAFAERAGKPEAGRWIDHTPTNIFYAPTLLREFESAPLIHIVRDPRATVASVLPLDWGPASARDGARWWLSRLGAGLATEAAFPDRVLRLRYEDLVREPRATLESLCLWAGLRFEPAMLGAAAAQVPAYTRSQHRLVAAAPDPSRAEGWRRSLTPRQIATIEGELGEVQAMLGYAPTAAGPALAGQRGARELAGATWQTARQHWRHRARLRQAQNKR